MAKRSNKKYSSEIHNEIMKHLKNNKSVPKTADIVGISKSTIPFWIKKGKEGEKKYIKFYQDYVKIMGEIGKRTKYTPEIHEKIIQYLKEGKTQNQIGELEQLDRGIIRRWVRLGKEGKDPYDKFYQDYENIEPLIHRRKLKNTKYNLKTHDEIIKYAKEKKDLEEIGKLLDLSPSTIKNWLKLGKKGKIKYKPLYNNYIEALGKNLNKIENSKSSEKDYQSTLESYMKNS